MATVKKVKELPIHLDILGQELAVGNYVAGARPTQYSSSMVICKIVKVTPKKVYLETVKGKREWSTWPYETIKLSGEDVMAFILKYA